MTSRAWSWTSCPERAEDVGVHVHLLAAEEPPLGIPREEDDHAPGQALAGRRVADPFGLVHPGYARLLADALRPDHDVRQVEVDVREGGQKLGVEPRRALVPFPAISALGELVDAVLGQRGDQPREVARVLGDRVTLPQLADLVVELGRRLPPEQLDDLVMLDVRELGHRANSAIVRSVAASRVVTSSVVAPDSRQAASRSAIRSRGPTSATSSTSAAGTAAIASRCAPPR